MNEAADIGSQLPAILLFVLWWALLTMLDISFPKSDPDRREPLGAGGAGADKVVAASAPVWQAVRKADPAFDADEFLRGASQAYEIILNAYVREDGNALRSLLSAEVLAAFEAAIADRRERHEKLHLTFICMKEACITGAGTDGRAVEIAVRFVAEVISAICPTVPAAVCNDTMRVVETGDLWVFGRDLDARDRNWRLIATDEVA